MMFAEKNRENTTAWEIDKSEKLLIKIDKNLNKVLKMIFNLCNIYIKYFNQIKNANKQCNEI